MTAIVYQLRDFQNPKDIDRMQRELEKEAAVLLEGGSTVVAPYGGQGIDGMPYYSPEKDPA